MASIRKRGSSFEIRVSDGVGASGAPKYAQMTWTPPKEMTPRKAEKEAQKQALLFEEKIRTGQFISSDVTLENFAARWFREHAEQNLKPTTVKGYRNLWPRVNAALGRIRLCSLQPQHLLKFYANLAEPGIRQDVSYTQRESFKALLKELGTTAESVAKQAGIGVRTIYSATSGGRIKPLTAQKICTVLDLPVEEVFSPVNSGAPLTGNTIRHYHIFLSALLRSAVEWQIIASNPCDRVTSPHGSSDEITCLEENDVAALVDALQEEPVSHRVMILLLLDSGMRRGELCGLEWKDIDFEHRSVFIRRNSVYVSGKGVYTDTPKTKRSKRIINLPEESISMLRQYRTWQLQERLKLGDQWQEHDRLFTQWNGTPIHPQSVTGWFRNFLKRHGLPAVSVHSLRHTNATLLIVNGTNIRTVSARLGHSQTSTTVDTYAYAIQRADAVAADLIGSIVHKRRKAE